MPNENLFLLLCNIFIFVLCGGMLMILPHLTRKAYLFGVKIPPEAFELPEVKSLKKGYISMCLIGVVILLAVSIIQYIMRPELTLFATLYFPLLIILLYLAAFVPNWKKAVSLKEERGWVVSDIKFADTRSSHSRGNLSTMPWAWYIISFLILAASIAITITRYPELPEMVAGHLGFDMQATRYIPKTWGSVMMMPLVNAGTFLIMFFVGISIEKTKLQIDPQNPRLSFAQHRVYRKRYGAAMGSLTLCLVIGMAGFGLALLYPESPLISALLSAVLIAILTIPIFIIIVVALTTGQGGNKVKIDIGDELNEVDITKNDNQGSCGRGEDRFWKIGMFYYNPNDSAYLVEDRFGTNLGFNFAKVPCMIGALLLIAGMAAMYVWLTVLLF
ncbi:MAG: DUF1648 domain-containing protein [Oscillospiraceae bacterium]|jgi:uncharacterized membrane protein|nr:DUF1648 domain-containing protein [Oscillospiraceae bacterium]